MRITDYPGVDRIFNHLMLTFIAENPPPPRKEKALEALDASLRLNPGQEEIKKLVDKIKKG